MDKIKAWLETTPYKDFELSVASADASFRQYYRLENAQISVLLMDSSLEKESLFSFIDITKRLRQEDVNAPQILESNPDEGFLIIEDFGSTHYLDLLDDSNYQELYKNAIDEIISIQDTQVDNLPIYDKDFLHFEMDLMKEWYLEGLLRKRVAPVDELMLANTLESISDIVLSQPQDTFVHRDFHSRNLMVLEDKSVGIIDYQDAMNGAITYDLVSLLKDCYIEFEEEDVQRLALHFRDKKGLEVGDEEFIKWFDFMGLQRHIKVLGVFARLYLRDGKNGYLKDIPLTLKYVFDTARKYDETKEFANFLKRL